MTTTTTKRLHISGLTPAITRTDLEKRFSTFGDVRDVDGVGMVNGLGEPRTFAYVTLEATRDKLARCMNLLSGSTWKGAKLRIGEAKPDYRARHELELNPPPRPKLDALALRRARIKRRLKARRLMRGTQGKEAKDMSLVTLENVSSRKGWRRTPLDHLIKPLRMRPLHPIPLPPKSRLSSSKSKLRPSKIKDKEKTKLKRKKFDLTRARCTVIDPARYGAVHVSVGRGGLGEELLGGMGGVEMGGVEGGMESGVAEMQDLEEEVEVEVASTISSNSEPKPLPPPASAVRDPTPALPPSPSPSPSSPPASSLINLPTKSSDSNPILSLAQEKASTLALLGGLFSGEEWGGRESLSGDEVEVQDGKGQGQEEDVGYEVVPREKEGVVQEMEVEVEEMMEEAVQDDVDEVEEVAEDEDEVEEAESEEDDEEEEAPAASETQAYTALKNMFKPQEESGSFSLGLDIELDPDAESFLPASIQPPEPQPQPSIAPISIQTTQKRTIEYTPDPRAMMFFPGSGGGRKDVFGVIEEKGWRWEHPGTSEEIRAKWDENKLELTREYSRRHREAVKKRRRGGGGRNEEP